MVRIQQRHLRCLGVAEKKEVANRVAMLEEQSQPTIETTISNLLSLSSKKKRKKNLIFSIIYPLMDLKNIDHA
jgi:predicted transcriptional regulator